MKHIKTYENNINDDKVIYYGVIKIHKLKKCVKAFKNMNISYHLYELIDDNNNYNVVTIATTTKQNRELLHKNVILTDELRTAVYIATNCKDITELTLDDIIKKYNMYSDTNKYNL